MNKDRALKALAFVGRTAKTIWDIPAVKSQAVTWLIRLGVAAPVAALIPTIVDALSS